MIFFWVKAEPSTTSHPFDTHGASPPPYWNPKYATACTVQYTARVVQKKSGSPIHHAV